MSRYSIKDVEELSGIRAHTLRIWEQRYGIVNPERTDTNIRYYTDDQLKLILNISLLNKHGIRISQIAKMTDDERNRRIAQIDDRDLQFENQIKALTFSMIDMREDQFEKVINTSILQVGFEVTMVKVIYPFLERVGTLWRSGAISPAQEHFISNLIRQKIIVAIDGQTAQIKSEQPKFLLFLPEGDLHELSLLFMHYLLRSRGIASIYLGATVPYADLESVIKQHRPNYVFTVMMVKPNRTTVEAYLKAMRKDFPEVNILVTGHKVLQNPKSVPKGVRLVSSLEESMSIVSELV